MGKGSEMVQGGSWMSKHVKRLYGDMPVDNRASALNKNGSIRPDYPDIDGDGDKKESMKQAAADKKSV